MRRPHYAIAGVTALALALAGCGGHDQASSHNQDRGAAAAVAESLPTPAVASVSATPSAPVSPSSSLAPSPSATKRAPTYDVAAVQRQLSDLKYYAGGVDGKAGSQLSSAVMAFQKVQGLSADGAVGPATLAALKTPTAPTLKASAPADRVEVDLTRQVLYVVSGGAIERIMPVSSGSGATYRQGSATARALTPVGWYKIQRRIVGERHAALGVLYNPQYFYRGWAIHGSNSVPAGPASHGCVRVTRADGTWLLSHMGVGTSVYLYGGSYTFPAGSSAAGTDAPSGDTDTPVTTVPSSPAPVTSATPVPSSSALPSPSTTPSPSATPSPVDSQATTSPSPNPAGPASASPIG